MPSNRPLGEAQRAFLASAVRLHAGRAPSRWGSPAHKARIVRSLVARGLMEYRDEGDRGYWYATAAGHTALAWTDATPRT